MIVMFRRDMKQDDDDSRQLEMADGLKPDHDAQNGKRLKPEAGKRIKGTMHFISPVLWQFLVNWMTNFALFRAEASTIAPQMDPLYFFLILISLVGLVLVGLLVAGFSIPIARKVIPSPRRLKAPPSSKPRGRSSRSALFMVCFVWGALLYFRIYNPPTNAMNIYVVGKQWMWKAEHPGGQHEINSLHVPISRPVQLTMISQDVFHSFSIPAFRVKREAIPGRYRPSGSTPPSRATIISSARNIAARCTRR